MSLVRTKKKKKENYSNAHTHKNKQNQTFLTITEIHNPNFITSKIQTSGPKIDENRKPLQLQDPQIRLIFALNPKIRAKILSRSVGPLAYSPPSSKLTVCHNFQNHQVIPFSVVRMSKTPYRTISRSVGLFFLFLNKNTWHPKLAKWKNVLQSNTANKENYYN